MKITSRQLKQIIREELASTHLLTNTRAPRARSDLNESLAMDIFNISVGGMAALGALVAGGMVAQIAKDIYKELNPHEQRRARYEAQALADKELKDTVRALSDDPELIALYQDLNSSITHFGGGRGSDERAEVDVKLRAIQQFLSRAALERDLPSAGTFGVGAELDNMYKKRRIRDQF